MYPYFHSHCSLILTIIAILDASMLVRCHLGMHTSPNSTTGNERFFESTFDFLYLRRYSMDESILVDKVICDVSSWDLLSNKVALDVNVFGLIMKYWRRRYAMHLDQHKLALFA
ncbi:hypothetical protein Lalb_Chr11g0068341 [Lupinus albus]|uniref:Uncharacterized protein n=1 Tax=Lupinus albus TaxID=3870 RepID=A0A6A4PRB8_LUPAL|nr:hypothetical protein Lalb_Chr11g0068341 [Lupinus albus]